MRSAADTLLNRLVSTTARVPGIVYKFPFLFSFRKVGEGVVLAPSPDISVIITGISGRAAHLIYRTPLVVPPFVVAWFVGEASVLAPSPGICTTATSFCWFYRRFRPAHSVRISLAPAVAPV